MKTLEIYRGKSKVNLKLPNGDVYDSSATLHDHDLRVGYWHSEYVNTDSTVGYNGGRLAKGTYYGIVGKSAKGKRVIKLFQACPDIAKKLRSAEQLTAAMMTHGGKYYVQYVYIHGGGLSWDFSHACISALDRLLPKQKKPTEYGRLMDTLKDNELITISLT
jgi:hypothetical protein